MIKQAKDYLLILVILGANSLLSLGVIFLLSKELGTGLLREREVDRPVETVVVRPGEAEIRLTPKKIFLILREEELEGKPIKNDLTEQDLRDMGLFEGKE